MQLRADRSPASCEREAVGRLPHSLRLSSPMARERASTTRQREAGVICCRCHAILPPVCRERYCKACEPRHRVYMHFQSLLEGWRVTFLDQDLKTPLPRVFDFQDPVKSTEVAHRGGADWTGADREALEHGISIGRGGIGLHLSQEQYSSLRNPKSRGGR
jgi:hypothetical protein